MSAAGPAREPLLPRHPLSLGDVVAGAVGLYRATAGTAARVVAVVYAPLAVLNSLAVTTTGDVDPMDPLRGLSGGDGTLLAMSTLVGMFVGPIVGAVLTVVALERNRASTLRWGDAYAAVAGLVGRVVLATLLWLGLAVITVASVLAVTALGATAGLGAAIFVGVVVGVPTVIALLTLSYLLVPAIVLEDARPAAALGRAWELLRVRLLATLGTVVVAAVLIGLVGIAIGATTAALSAVAGPAGLVVDAAGSTLSAVVTVPLLTYVALLIYVDGAVRLDGPDALPVAGASPLPPGEGA